MARADLIVALTSPPLIGVVGLIKARIHKARFVHWTMDLNPDEVFATGWLQRDSLAGRLLERSSRWMLSGADLVIALDRFMQARILSKGASPRRVCVLPPWSHQPEVRFDPEGRERFRLQYGLRKKFVVMYSGNHTSCHPVDTILRAAETLAEDPEIVFCFVGGGSEFRRIERGLIAPRLPEDSPRPNIVCLPYQPRSELSASLSAADLHLVLMGPDFVGIVHPCKIYNVLAIGCPVVYIGPSPSPTLDTLERPELKASYCALAHGDVIGLVSHILRVRNHSARHSLTGRSPSAASGEPLLNLIAQLECLANPSGCSAAALRTAGELGTSIGTAIPPIMD
jgi:hypothetical protein